jgi:benzoate/toluate 1,2-dioxygenase beta subunit
VTSVSAAVQELLFREARLLDRERYDEWLALFTDDCEYWVPASPDQSDPRTHVSLFYEDRILMETRIRRLRHPRAHSLVPRMRSCRLLSNILIEREAPDEVVVGSVFHMDEYRGERQRSFAGHCTHRLRRNGGALRIRSKRVDLINCDSAFEVLQVFI